MGGLSGWFAYKGILTMQHETIEEVLKTLFETTKPSQVLEIGTSNGGLTLIIRNTLDELNLTSTELITYDVALVPAGELDKLMENGSKMKRFVKQIFKNDYSDLIEDEVAPMLEYIQQSGTTIVMCDGGYKIGEFNILSRYLKPGDIIMAHDYSPNHEYFTEHIKEKIWDWLEIQDIDIEGAVVRNNLEPFMENEFRNVVWVCKIKK
jgi:hypothetical protein